MTIIEKIEKGIITLTEFTEDQQTFIKGIVKLSFNEGLEQALRMQAVVGRSEQCAHTSTDIRTLRCNCCNDCGEILEMID